MSDNNICAICGGIVGRTFTSNLVYYEKLGDEPPITFCPGHATTDIDIAGHSRIMYTGVVPQGTSVSLDSFTQHEETLWQIAQEVAGADVTGYNDIEVCPFCGNGECYMRHGEEFPHSPTCIVTKARALMEWRKAHVTVNKEVPLD